MKYCYNSSTKKVFEVSNDYKIEDDSDVVEISKFTYRKWNSQDVIKNMIDTYGEDTQIDVAIEEMSELIKELIKYKRAKIHQSENNPRRQYVLEEMGDVFFMMEYLKYIFSIDESDIDDVIIQKSKRTAERYL